MVKIVLKSESEAFQFFDSQNARGKDLEPHDLLKAFHLREMNDSESSEKIAVVSQWEDIKSEDLAELFALYLYLKLRSPLKKRYHNKKSSQRE